MIRLHCKTGLIKGLIFLVLFLPFTSCIHDPQLIEGLEPVCYSTEIDPLLQASCGTVGCHATPGNETSFGTDSYNSVMSIVRPGDARNSKLYQVITDINSDDMMPPDQPLSLTQRNTIMIWIEQGAENLDCTTDTTTPPVTINSDSVCFTQIIQPLLLSSCATSGCHDAASHREGIVLSSYNSIMNSEEGVVPYQPNESKIYEVLFEDGEDRMPPPPLDPLTEEEKEFIRQWIADGALNSDCPDTSCDTVNEISFSESVYPVIQLSCTGCHNASSASGGVNLSDYTHITEVASTTVGGESWLVGVIRKDPGFTPMPPSGSLSDCSVRQVELWIEQGMQNN